MNRTGRAAVAVFVVAAGLAALSGCSSGGSSDDDVIAPVTVDYKDVDGTTQEIVVGQSLVISGDDDTFDKWDADVDDAAVLSFTPGKDDGSAQFNPGFEGLKAGTTEVEMTNSESGDTLDFTVEVSEK